MNDLSIPLPSDERFLQFLPVGYFAVRVDGIVSAVNQALAASLGFHPQEMIGRSVSDFIADQESARQFQQFLLSGNHGRPMPYVANMTTRERYPLAVSLFGVSEYMPDGSYWGVRGVALTPHQVQGVAASAGPAAPPTTGIAERPLPQMTEEQRQQLERLYATLTPREQDVVDLLRSGLRVQGVAECLELSHYTVRNHLKRIFRKANVSSQGELLMLLNRPGTRQASKSEATEVADPPAAEISRESQPMPAPADVFERVL